MIDLEIIKWKMIKADLENDDALQRFKWEKKYSVCLFVCPAIHVADVVSDTEHFGTDDITL